MSKRPLVLLIDDDRWLLDHYERVLTHAGFRVRSAVNALDGIEAIDRLHPDVIVLDIFMPGPNGIVLLHEIRSHSGLAQIPVIVCSNSALDLSSGQLSAYGVYATLDKATMHPDDLVSAIKKVLP